MVKIILAGKSLVSYSCYDGGFLFTIRRMYKLCNVLIIRVDLQNKTDLMSLTYSKRKNLL